MFTRFIAIIVFLFATLTVRSQLERRNVLTQRQVASLVNLLYKTRDDVTSFNIQIRLAKYMLEQGLSRKADSDSVGFLVRQAKEINAKKLGRKEDGLILLYEATLLRLNGNTDSARQLLTKAIGLFKSAKDNFRLTEAYLELSRHYNANDLNQVAAINGIIDTVFRIVPKLIPPNALDSSMATVRNFYWTYMYYDNPAIRTHYLDQFGHASQMLNDKKRQFWVRKEKAYVLYDQGHLDTAIKLLVEVAKEEKEGSYSQICYTYNRLTLCYFMATDYKKAMASALEATKHIRDATDSALLSHLFMSVAVNYKQRGNPEEAIEWNLKAVNYMNVTQDYQGLYNVLADLVRDMLPVGRAEEALKIIRENTSKSPAKENWQKIQLLINLAQVYEALHNKAAAEKHAEALVQLIDSVKTKEPTDSDFDYRANVFLASFYLNSGKYDKSETYFRKAMAGWPKSAAVQRREYEHRFKYRLDSARGEFHSAFNHFKTWHKVMDSVLSVTKAKEFDEIQTAYKTEQKDSLIKLKDQNIQLLTNQEQLQKSKLEQGIILRNISFAAVGLSLILIALFYNRFRLKQRTNKELEIKQAEIGQQNAKLRRVVDEKEWLLKEIHHRVKNNLQIVMSLLNSQSAYIDNEPALTAIHDSQHRVHAMSLIHQKLYASENVSSIDMTLYIRELTAYLTDSFDTRQRIRFTYSIEPLELDVSQAIPLGLILNEAITNSIKYAFPNNREGVINLTISNTSGSQYLLEISDNGIGIPPDLKNKKTGSLGMSLMAGLSEDLEGSFSIENNGGTAIKVLFVHNTSAKRQDSLIASFVTSN